MCTEGWVPSAENFGRIDNHRNSDAITSQILDLIDGASQRVWLKVPWWDPQVPQARAILDAVIAAKKRGADVRVIIRADQESERVQRDLQSAGITWFSRRHEHGKELLADNTHLFFSMNFTRKEMHVNSQNGMIDNDPVKVAQHAQHLESEFRDASLDAELGEERYTPAAEIVPSELLPFLEHRDLNPLQALAAPAILHGKKHTLVIAPTGAGKTVIGELAVLRAIKAEGLRAAWLVPARALSNELSQLQERWGNLGINVAELTGEDNLESETLRKAHLWITTTEKFEALYRRATLGRAIAEMACIVVDEVHLVGDPERGPTLEALLARLRQVSQRTRIVALSATAANAGNLSEWLDADLVQSTWRPTRLTTQIVTYQPADILSSSYHEEEERKTAALLPIVKQFRRDNTSSEPGSVLIFCGGKKAVRALAARIAGVNAKLEEGPLQAACNAKGVGFHYRGWTASSDANSATAASRGLATAADVVKSFNRRDIKVLVATSGLSTGVNTPARAVIVRDLVLGMDPISVSQVQQMFGRAGRAGHEPHGWAYLICPEDLAQQWRDNLAMGFRVESRILSRLADALLAEVLLGGVQTHDQAQDWFSQTFAAWSLSHDAEDGGAREHLDEALGLLINHGFVTSDEANNLVATEIGRITSRLMVEVPAAVSMLNLLRSLALPNSGQRAEESIVRAVAKAVPGFAAPPVNERDYGALVSRVLGEDNATPAITNAGPEALPEDKFGQDFTLTAAKLALEHPDELKRAKLTVQQGEQVVPLSLLPVKDILEQLPRYLAWLARVGNLGALSWQSAVAADLSQRITWWRLSPQPYRGSGRLLWLLSECLPVELRKPIMQKLWADAFRGRKVTHPDGIDAERLAAHVTELVKAEGRDESAIERHLSRHLDRRLNMQASIDHDSALPAISVTGGKGRLLVYTGFHGDSALTICDEHLGGTVVPGLPSTAVGDCTLAFDALWLGEADFAYTGILEKVNVPAEKIIDRAEVTDQLLSALPDSTYIQARQGVRDKLFRTKRIEREALLSLASGSGFLEPLAIHLAAEAETPHERAFALGQELWRIIQIVGAPESETTRTVAQILQERRGTESERSLVYVALAKSAGLEADLARGKTTNDLYPLVRLNETWWLVDTPQSGQCALEILGDSRSGQSTYYVLPKPPEQVLEVKPTIPLLSFLQEFLPRYDSPK